MLEVYRRLRPKLEGQIGPVQPPEPFGRFQGQLDTRPISEREIPEDTGPSLADAIEQLFPEQKPTADVLARPEPPLRAPTLSQIEPDIKDVGQLRQGPNPFRLGEGFTVDNPVFEDQTPEEQEEAQRIFRGGGPGPVLAAGLEPPRFPSGKIGGVGQAFAEAFPLVKPSREVRDSSPTLNAIGTLSGEAVKYAALRGAGKLLGASNITAEGLAGFISGATRPGATLENTLLEMTGAAALPGVFRQSEKAQAIQRVQNGPSVPASIAKGVRPITQGESVSMISLGYTPEMAAMARRIMESTQQKWANAVDVGWKKALSIVPYNISHNVKKFFVGTAPKEAKKIFKQAGLEAEEGRTMGRSLAETIEKEIPKEHQLNAFKAIDPSALDDVGGLPQEFDHIVKAARGKIDELGEQYIAEGLLPAEVVGANKGTFLSRYYKTHEGDDVMGALKDWWRTGIRGKQLKKRKLLTVAEREKAGLITDPAYAVARTVGDMSYDLSLHRAFSQIAKNADWVDDAQREGFKLIDNLPNKWGKLAGKWVDPDIWDELTVMNTTRSDWGRLYDKLLGAWKFGKTAGNPATHGRNIFSNTILADLGGLSPLRLDIYAQTAKDYLKKGQFYKEATSPKAGNLLTSDWYRSEVQSFVDPLKKGTGSTLDAFSDRLAGTNIARGAKTVTGALGKAYQAEEHFFKLALFIQKRKQGWSIERAAANAQKHLFDYSDISPALKRLRRNPLGGPFLTFTAKALPVVAESAVKNPIKFWKYYAGFEAMNQYSRAVLGISDAEYNRLKKSLPDWQKNGWNVLMPVKDKADKYVFLDLTYNLPWGDIGEQGSFIPIPVLGPIAERFVGGNPLARGLGEQVFNRNLFTGKELTQAGVDERIPSGIPGISQNVTKRVKHFFQQMAPGIVINVPPIIESVMGAKTRSGEEIDPFVTIANKLFGIKVRSADPDKGESIKLSKLRRDLRGVTTRAISVSLDESLTEEERQRQFDLIIEAGKGIIEEAGEAQ